MRWRCGQAADLAHKLALPLSAYGHFAERRQGRRLPDPMIPRALHADLTSSSPARRRSRGVRQGFLPRHLLVLAALNDDGNLQCPSAGLWRQVAADIGIGPYLAQSRSLPRRAPRVSRAAPATPRLAVHPTRDRGRCRRRTALPCRANSCLAGYARCASRGKKTDGFIIMTWGSLDARDGSDASDTPRR